MIRTLLAIMMLLTLFHCSKDNVDKKGFQVRELSENEEGKKIVGLPIDSLKLETKPRNVLLTKNPGHRLTPIYKVNYNHRTGKPFTGSNKFHNSAYWEGVDNKENNWNGNFMPGFEAVYGYNFVNISHYDNLKRKETLFFDKPVLVKTLYYPALSKDTLNNIPVDRGYYMVSVYNDDTNKDGYINLKDLRRIYYFDIDVTKSTLLIPENYSVMSCEYDPENDYMYVFAKRDENNNGQVEYEESTHIFWIDLDNPENRGIQYENE